MRIITGILLVFMLICSVEKSNYKGNKIVNNQLLLGIILSLFVMACNGCSKLNIHIEYADYDMIEVIIVNKIPKNDLAKREMSAEMPNFGWYDIGLSRNGKKPIEYIWEARGELDSSGIVNAKIGNSGLIYINDLGKSNQIKLPKPNTKKSPNVNHYGLVNWASLITINYYKPSILCPLQFYHCNHLFQGYSL